MPDSNLTKLTRKTMLSMLRSAAGTTMFQHIYVRRKSDGEELDTVQGGELSCAFFVSSMLAITNLIDSAHATVQTTVARMQEAGWQQIATPRAGAVAVWPEYDGHEHIGFVLDNDEYISNSLIKRVPHLHKQQLPDGRVPRAYYTRTRVDYFVVFST